jgi:hypothetical protein
MKTINLLRPQHFATSDGETKMLQAMLMNAYRQGLLQGEKNMAARIIRTLDQHERRFMERRVGERRAQGGGI